MILHGGVCSLVPMWPGNRNEANTISDARALAYKYSDHRCSSKLDDTMAEAVAAKVLGPRPGKAIVSFWQGRVEIFLRFLAGDVSMRLAN